MPNWCNNYLTVRGKTQELENFRKIVADPENNTDLSLAKTFPLPRELEGTTAPNPDPESVESKLLKKAFGVDNWYDWQIQNWGTKWDIEATLLRKNKYSLGYAFMSAWSPPVEWMKNMSKRFPMLHFSLSYDESGVGYEGCAKAKDGHLDDNCRNM